MESENKVKEIFEKVKVNAINVVAITLSVIAIVLSIIAISGNAHRRDLRPNKMNYAYENRMGGQNFNQNPNGPGVWQNAPGKNGNRQRSARRIAPRGQNGLDGNTGPTPQIQQGPGEQQNNAPSEIKPNLN